MKSIDKLRDLVADINAKEIVEHMQLYPNCVFDCRWLDSWHSEFNRLIESLEAEIADNYLELPVDADGVPIHVGDTVEGELLFDNATVKGTVCAYHIHDDDEPGTVYIRVKPTEDTWTIKELRFERCRHFKPRTLEDVLRDVWKEALDYAKSDMWRNPEEVFTERADEIRELLGGEGESDET